MNLDDIFVEIGEFGKYQKLVLWFILLPGTFPCGFHAYNQLFMSAIPEHWCKIPELQHLNIYEARNISIPVEELLHGHSRFSQCFMYDLNYTDLTVNTLEILNLNSVGRIPCNQGWIYDGIDVRHTIVAEWNLVCNKSFLSTLALILFGVGGFIGTYIFGYLQDGFGRKPAFFVYLLILCIFGTATAFASNFFLWTLFRIGVGFTVPAILSTPYVLAIELVGPKQRSLVTILINIAYSLALVSVSVVVWAIRDWRYLALSTTLPFFGLFLYWWMLPESPRWLLAQGRIMETERIFLKMAEINGKKVPSNFHRKLKEIVEQEKFGFVEEESYGIFNLFQTPNLRWKTLIVTFIWFTNTSVYVGLSYYAPILGGDVYLNFFLAGAVELPTYLILWPAMERVGRRKILCASMVIGGIACLATVLFQNDSLVTLCLYCFGKMGISSSFVIVPLMASELYPTVVRGLGMSISSLVGMLGPIFIPVVNYLGSDMLTLPLIIMGAMLVIGSACSLLLPETLNRHLPQTLHDAEEVGFDCCTLNRRAPVEKKMPENSIEILC